MDGTVRSTKQTKIKHNVSFIFIPKHPNGLVLGLQEHIQPHYFIQDYHQNRLEGCCLCNLLYSVLLR